MRYWFESEGVLAEVGIELARGQTTTHYRYSPASYTLVLMRFNLRDAGQLK